MQKKISKTKIKKNLKRKTNPELKEAIFSASKNPNWISLAKILTSPSRKKVVVNLNQIDKKTSAGDTIIVPGKVLSAGDLTKKIKICSISISKSAKDKLKKTKSEFIYLSQEIKTNQKAEGVKLIT